MKKFFILFCFILAYDSADAGFGLDGLRSLARTISSDVTAVVTRIESVAETVVDTTGSVVKTLTDFKGYLQTAKHVATEIEKHLESYEPDNSIAYIKNKIGSLIEAIEKSNQVFRTIGSCASIPTEWFKVIGHLKKEKEKVDKALDAVREKCKHWGGTYALKVHIESENTLANVVEFIKSGEKLLVKSIHEFLDIVETHPWAIFIPGALLDTKTISTAIVKVKNMLRDGISGVINKIKDEVLGDIEALIPDDIEKLIEDAKSLVSNIAQLLEELPEISVSDITAMRDNLTEIIDDSFGALTATSEAILDDFTDTFFSFEELFVEIVEAELKNEDGIVHKIGGLCKAVGLFPDTVLNFADCIINETTTLVRTAFTFIFDIEKIIRTLYGSFDGCRASSDDAKELCIKVAIRHYRDVVVEGTEEVLKLTKFVANMETIRHRCKQNVIDTFLGATVGKPENPPECK